MGPDAVAVFLGARLATRSNDTEYPFRQDSDFWYLTGFDHPNAVAVLRTDGGPAYTLFVEPRDREAETWTGFRPGVEGAVSDYDADEAHPAADFVGQLPRCPPNRSWTRARSCTRCASRNRRPSSTSCAGRR